MQYKKVATEKKGFSSKNVIVSDYCYRHCVADWASLHYEKDCGDLLSVCCALRVSVVVASAHRGWRSTRRSSSPPTDRMEAAVLADASPLPREMFHPSGSSVSCGLCAALFISNKASNCPPSSPLSRTRPTGKRADSQRRPHFHSVPINRSPPRMFPSEWAEWRGGELLNQLDNTPLVLVSPSPPPFPPPSLPPSVI